MHFDLLIKGGEVVDPGGGQQGRLDVAIKRNRIAAVEANIPAERVKQLAAGHPNLLDHRADGEVTLILNTPSGKGARTDEGRIRAAAVQQGIPSITTIQAAEAAVKAMEALREEDMSVLSLQDRFAEIAAQAAP